jgi:glucose/arabinose dehydrogenase
MRTRVLVAVLAVFCLTAGAAQASARPAGIPGDPEQVAGDLTIPWAISWLPDGQSALVTQRNDFHVLQVGRDGSKTDVGVVPESETTDGEGGLMGVAVSPTWDGAGDTSVYFLHTAAEGNRVARMSFDGSSLSGYEVIVDGIAKNRFHNGGRLAFGPDGFLYATAGDAQDTDSAQDQNSLNGKILRFTVDGDPAPGNPFGTLVYSMGHRNPQGLAWDSAGNLWAAEFGQNTFDELNLIEPGNNYGWPICEGVCDDDRFTDPKATWTTAEASPSGLAIVGDTAFMAALRGERLWRIELSGTDVVETAAHFTGEFGRMRAVVAVPGASEIWISTSNADGNGGQPPGSDQLLRSAIS